MEETMAANKLAERIVNQAVSDADQVRAEGDTQVRDFLSSQGKKRDALIADTASKREAAVKGVLDGARTRALIDGRKATLTRKREAIEKAFALAAQRMGDFTQEESYHMILRVMEQEYEPGETVAPAAADRGIVEKAAASMHIPVSPEDASICRGFILKGSGYEKDCSFSSILGNVRDRQETAVAGMLFNQ